MVAQLLRLRARAAVNGLRVEGRSRFVSVGGTLLALAAAIAIAVIWSRLESSAGDATGVAIILTGALGVLGLLVVPVFLLIDDPLDPRRLALLGVEPAGVPVVAAAVASIPGLLAAILAVGQAIVWAGEPDAAVFAIIAVPLIITTVLLSVRVSLSVAAIVRGHRAALLATRIVLGAGTVLILSAIVGAWFDDGADASEGAAAVLGWTPLGATWSAPAVAAAGETGTAVAQVALGLLYVAVLAAGWRLLARHVLAAREEGSARRRVGLGWFSLFPATATGAIAARTFSYWIRDPRYAVSLIIVPVFPLLLVLPMAVAGIPTDILALIPVPVAALFLGWSIHNDTAHDNNALWLHVVSHTSGIADRLGRAIPILLVATPILVIGSFVSADVYGDPSLLPTMLGLSFCIFLCGVGTSSVISVLLPYPVVRPGENPFTSPQSAGGGSSRTQTISFAAMIVLSIPTVILAWKTVFEDESLASTTLGVGLASGVIVLLAGLIGGGAIFARRRTALLAFSMRN